MSAGFKYNLEPEPSIEMIRCEYRSPSSRTLQARHDKSKRWRQSASVYSDSS